MIPRGAEQGEGIVGGGLVAGDKRHVGKAIHLQIGSAVKALQVCVALLYSRPGHAGQGIPFSVALAGEEAGNFKVDNGAVRIAEPGGDFFGEGLGIALLPILLGEEKIRVLPIVMIVGGFKCGGLVE